MYSNNVPYKGKLNFSLGKKHFFPSMFEVVHNIPLSLKLTNFPLYVWKMRK